MIEKVLCVCFAAACVHVPVPVPETCLCHAHGPVAWFAQGRNPEEWKPREVALTVLVDRWAARGTRGRGDGGDGRGGGEGDWVRGGGGAGRDEKREAGACRHFVRLLRIDGVVWQ